MYYVKKVAFSISKIPITVQIYISKSFLKSVKSIKSIILLHKQYIKEWM